MEDAVGVADAIEVVVDFGTEGAAGEGVAGVAAERYGLVIFDFDQPCAGIRAVMSAGAADDGEWRVHWWHPGREVS
jgi:hypothetical protein